MNDISALPPLPHCSLVGTISNSTSAALQSALSPGGEFLYMSAVLAFMSGDSALAGATQGMLYDSLALEARRACIPGFLLGLNN